MAHCQHSCDAVEEVESRGELENKYSIDRRLKQGEGLTCKKKELLLKDLFAT